MFWLLFFLLGVAQAGEGEQRFTWDLKVSNQHVGRRILVIKDLDGRWRRRVMEIWTEINASNLGSRFTYKQRLTGNIMGGPASFHSVVQQGGRPKEIQGRRTGLGWQIAIVQKGRARSWSLDADEVDLSTVDLLNPESRVHLTRLKQARILSAETGDVLEGDVVPMGTTELYIAGTSVQAQGFKLESENSEAVFYYTSNGVLVKYETYLMGLRMSGTLMAPPPPGKDQFPVAIGGGSVEEVDLL